MRQVREEGGEVGLAWKDCGRRSVEAVCDPAEDRVPESRQLVKCCHSWLEEVGPIGEDREDEAVGEAAAHMG